MKELIKRAFFGLLYALIVILALQNYTWTAILLGIFLFIALKELSALVNFNFKTFLLPAVFVYLTGFLFSSPVHIDIQVIKVAIAFALLTLFIPMIYFIFDKLSLQMLANGYLGIVYLAIPFTLALNLDLHFLLGIFLIIWASDSFAYLTGKNFGKHKLAEKISPKKTIEGVIGGWIGSLLVGYIIFRYTNWYEMLNLSQFLILTTIIVIFGTLGDLLESRFKRLAQVKDSGQVIPGHGGILDRLDSFILAVPFVYIYLSII